MDSFEIIKKHLEKRLNVKFATETSEEELFIEQEKKDFIAFVDSLETIIDAEDNLFLDYKIDTTSIVKPYWSAIEGILTFSVGEEAKDLIMWYLFQRKDEKGIIEPWIDYDATKYMLLNSSDLYELIIHKFSE